MEGADKVDTIASLRTALDVLGLESVDIITERLFTGHLIDASFDNKSARSFCSLDICSIFTSIKEVIMSLTLCK